MNRQILIDSHTHVQFPAYDQDRETVIGRALDAGVGMINIGTTYSTSEGAVRLAERYESGIWATVGMHPSHAAGDEYHDPWELRDHSRELFDISKFRNVVSHPKVVAVGECGLDYFRIKNPALASAGGGSASGGKASAVVPSFARGCGGHSKPLADKSAGKDESGIKEEQRKVFADQIELALEVGKPLAIHCRPSNGTQDAYDDAYRILNSCFSLHNSTAGGVMHFFVGNTDTARKFLDLGFYISFAGPITFAKEYEEVVRYVPLDRIMVETDAPYAAPVPYRGKRNEPLYVREVASKIGGVKNLDFEEVTEATVGNTKKLFKI